MAVSIGSLRYDIVADTSKFTKGLLAARSELTLAKRVMRETQSPAEALSQSLAKLEAIYKKGAIDAETYRRAVGKVKAEFNETAIAANKASSGFSAIALNLKTAATAFVAYKAAGEIRSGFEIAAELESTAASFEVLTGSATRAAMLVEQLRKYDAQTTFDFADTTKAAEKLMNFGVASDDVIDTLKRLGDVSMGDRDRLSRLALAFGQANAAGRLMGGEVRQMVEAGFNPLQEIAKMTGETMDQVRDRMESGSVAITEVSEALKSATSEGGRFFGMVDKRSQTMAGQLDLLRGEWNMLKSDIAEFAMPAAKGGVGFLRGIMDGFKTSREGLVDLVMNQSGMARTVGGNEKANKILNDLATYERRVREAEEARKKGSEEMFNKAKSAGAGIWDGIKSAAGLAVSTAKEAAPGIAGIGQQTLLKSNLGYLEKQYAALAKIEKSTSIQAATAAQRGSREEYMLRAATSREREHAAENWRRHNEAQEKRNEILEAMNAIREKLDMPTLVPMG